MKQEYRAVVSAFDRVHVGALKWPDRAIGDIDGKTCCVFKTGMGSELARSAIDELFRKIDRPKILLSIGLAGGLLTSMRIGQRFLISAVERTGIEPLRLLASLSCVSPAYQKAVGSQWLRSVDQPMLDPSAKAELHLSSGAGLCDMETYAVADAANARGLPWIGGRIVSDTVNEALRQWYMQMPSLMEERRWFRVFSELATHPQDFPSLIRLGLRMKTLERQLTQFTVELIRNVVQP